jgi:hypothetical protein
MFATVSTGYDRYMSSHFIPNLQKRCKGSDFFAYMQDFKHFFSLFLYGLGHMAV